MKRALRSSVLLAVTAAAAGCAVSTSGTPVAAPAPSSASSAPSTSASPGGGACTGSIAFLGDLTGESSVLVVPIRDGAKLALDRFSNERPECSVELVELDSQAKEDHAVALARRAVDDDDVLGVVGGAFSGESKAARTVLAPADLAMISPSATNPDLSATPSPVFHRVAVADDAHAAMVGRHLTKGLKARKVFLVDDGGAYGTTFVKGVKAALGKATAGSTKIRPGQRDFGDAVSKIKAKNPDAVVYGGYYPEAGRLAKQLRDGGVRAKFVSGDGALDKEFAELAGPAAEDALLTCSCVLAGRTKGDFAAEYEARYGVEPPIYAAEGYDAATVLLDAIAAGNQTREDVLAFVDAYDKDGVTRPIRFDRTGDLDPSVASIWMYVFRDGKLTADQEIGP